MYKGVIFDLDGTLLNTLYDLSDSVNQALEAVDCPTHSYDCYRLMIGGGFRNLIERSLPEHHRDDDTINYVLAMFLSIYDVNYMNKTVPYEGIIRLIKELKNSNIKIAVNSNKRTDYTKALIHKFFSDVDFVDVIGERKGHPKKPDPSAALEIAGLMGLEPCDVVYVGDSKTDMITAKNAGMDSIGVTWGFRDEKELRQYGATNIVNEPQEIWRIATRGCLDARGGK